MFAELDETIRQLLVSNVPLNPSEVDVSFDAPDREWSGRLTRPAINCFLYDVRENQKLRVSNWEITRENNHATKRKQPMRIDASYQVSAWARVPEDEHRLLWRVLATLARHPTLPSELLQGSLKEQPFPIPASVGQPDQMPTNFADLWQALENRIRPALTYVVTLALEPDVVEVTPLTLKAPSINLNSLEPREMEEALRIRGRVRDRQDSKKVIEGALVVIQETGDRSLTDAEGWFTFPKAPRGPVTLVVRANGKPESTSTRVIPSPDYDLEV